jgi:hypothetical protein
MLFYPPWYQKKVEAWRRGEIDWDTGKPIDSESSSDVVQYEKMAAEKIEKLTVYLRLDSMPNLLAFTSLFGGTDIPAPKTHPSKDVSTSASTSLGKDVGETSLTEVTPPNRPVEAYGLRLLNLTDRGSSVMQVSELESYTAYDPVVNTFRTFGRLHNLAVSGEVLVVPESSFAETLATRASDSQFLIMPWSETGGMSEQAVIEDKGTKNKLEASSYNAFVHETMENASIPVAVLINKNFGGSKNKEHKQQQQRLKLNRTYSSVSLGSAREKTVTAPITDKSHHVFFPFFGGNDDRTALRLVLQLAKNPQVTATVVHFDLSDSVWASLSSGTTPPTTREQDAAFFASLRASLPADLANRVVFETVTSTAPVADVIARASIEIGQSPRNAGDLIVLGRNVTMNAALDGSGNTDEIRSSSGAAQTLGVLAERVWEGKLGASVLIVKAGV